MSVNSFPGLLGSRLCRAIDEAEAAGNETWGESCKRVPARYDADHPHVLAWLLEISAALQPPSR